MAYAEHAYLGVLQVPGTPILIFLFALSQAPLMMVKHMPDEQPADAEPPTDAA